jgi:PAS domain S-box-containing protein
MGKGRAKAGRAGDGGAESLPGQGILERLVEVLEVTSDLVSTAMADGRIVYINRGGRAMLGLAGEARPDHGLRIGDLHPAWAMRRIATEGIPAALATGHWQGETAIRRFDDGREVPVSQVILGHRNPDGEIGFLSTIMRDLSAERVASSALREQSDYARLLIEHLPMGIYLYELKEDGRLVFTGTNPAADRIVGLDNAQFIGMTIEEAFPGLAAAGVAERYREVVRTGVPWATERLDYHAGGIDGAFEVHAFCPAPGRLAVIFRDNADRLRADAALRESEARHREISSLLESLFNAIPDVIGIQDAEHGIVRYNRAGYAFLERTPEDVAGRKCYQVLGRSEPCEVCATAEVYRTKRPARLEKWVESLGVWLDCRAYPVLDDEGNLVKVIEHLHDITERKRAEIDRLNLERQIQQAQKMESLGVMAGGIAHDFNNILMAVMGNAELALKEISPLSPGRECLQEIVTAARRAAELCRQMLAYAGRASFEAQPTAVAGVVEEMAHLLKSSISKKAILNLHLADGLPQVQADPSQIRQVVMNLILNASDAIGERSGVITVTVGATRCDEDYLRKTELENTLAPGLYLHLEVSDTGCGMDARTRERIFEPFFTTKFTGRGLGLAAVLGIVRAHGGALKVYSEPGKGTTFKILFPALEPGTEPAPPPASQGEDAWRGAGTILLADDEESLRALGARMLERLGFRVLVASDGHEAVDLYRQHHAEVALVLLDLTMPHMDGVQAFAELRRIDPEVRVILASGYSERETEARFAGKGLAGVMQKPYSLANLRRILRQALG